MLKVWFDLTSLFRAGGGMVRSTLMRLKLKFFISLKFAIDLKAADLRKKKVE